MDLHVFGSSCPAGYHFKQKIKESNLFENVISYSRKDSEGVKLDMDSANKFIDYDTGNAASWISFAPIWTFSKFLQNLEIYQPTVLKAISSIIVCSSTSVTTKRFSNNSYDKKLVTKLLCGEELIQEICKKYSIYLDIIRPTLIYGKGGPYKDKNISLLILLMRVLPFLILPSNSGLRQPIHSSQLSEITLHTLQKSIKNIAHKELLTIHEIGGDSNISYRHMLSKIKDRLPKNDLAKFCFIIAIPNRLFLLFATPLILIAPHVFDSIARISADLSGFTKAHEFLDKPPRQFPIKF